MTRLLSVFLVCFLNQSNIKANTIELHCNPLSGAASGKIAILTISNNSESSICFWDPSSLHGGGSLALNCTDTDNSKCQFYTNFEDWMDGISSEKFFMEPHETIYVELNLDKWKSTNEKFNFNQKTRIQVSGNLSTVN